MHVLCGPRGPWSLSHPDAAMDAKKDNPVLRADDWWTLGLTSTVRSLMCKLSAQASRVHVDLEHAQALQRLQSLQKEVSAALFELGTREELERENARLRAELQVARGTEEALHEVIKRHLSGSPPLSWPGGGLQGSGAK